VEQTDTRLLLYAYCSGNCIVYYASDMASANTLYLLTYLLSVDG